MYTLKAYLFNWHNSEGQFLNLKDDLILFFNNFHNKDAHPQYFPEACTHLKNGVTTIIGSQILSHVYHHGFLNKKKTVKQNRSGKNEQKLRKATKN